MKYQQGTVLIALLLALSQVCQAQIQCYICDDCDKIKPDTPLQRCDASFFETTDMSTTMATTPISTETSASSLPMTDTTTSTTEMPTTTSTTTTTTTSTSTTTSTTTTTTPTTTSTVVTDESTTGTSSENSTADTTITEGSTVTEDLPPTPSIVTTTPIPTPPTEGIVPTDGFIVLSGNETVNSPPYMLANRRRRATADSNNFTYHCYRMSHLVNGTSVTKRGCTRVNTMQSVCGELSRQDPTASKCYPCSMTRCNGSSALGTSVIAIFLAVVAAFLRSQ